ncbi:MAG: leucine-rich repeat protein, partial [Butyricicoccus sp.]|nr:leucine-rich repeat protein [Butyricicoccus sp.]
IAVGDILWSVDRTKLYLMDLQNEGYVLQNNGSDVVLDNDHCGANGDNLRWKLSRDGVLTIWGEGDMEDFWMSVHQPWTYEKTQIYVTKVIVEEGVTSLGKAAFSYLEKLTDVQLPESLRKIGSWSFEGTAALQRVQLPAGLQTIERNIFNERKTAPEQIIYDGCRHQWAKIDFDTEQSVWVQPTFLPNTNKDDGNCLTELRCSVCGGVDVAAREAHTGGTATCTALAECEVCGTAYGDYGHVFDQEAVHKDYLQQAETCTTAAVYFKSCICGAKGTGTFEGPAPRGHVYDREVEGEQYLLYEGTCEEGAYYFKSCVCGLCGDADVFIGAPLGHAFTEYADQGDGTEKASCIRACGETDTRYRTFAQLFPDAGFRAYVTGTVLAGNADDKADEAHLTAAQMEIIRAQDTILLLNRSDIASLQGIGLFSGLTSLTCVKTGVTELDLSRNTALTHLDCSSNALTALNISKNTALETLNCSACGLTALDVSANTALTSLECPENALTVLGVRRNTALVSLHCNDNALAALDIGANTALEVLDCSNNGITALDVGANTALYALNCSKNALTALDLSASTALMSQYCVPDGQTPAKTTPVVEDTGRGWTFDLAAFLGENGDPTRVTMTDGGSLENGIVTYERKPAQVTYCYDTGVENVPLDVTWTAVHGPAHVHIYNCENTDSTYRVSPASCTAAAIYYKSCSCGAASDETFPYGKPLEHTYDRQSAAERYLASPASCTAAARYYFSCSCGAQGEETFAYGEPLQHVYDQKNTDETYLKTPATCTKAAFYYKSCVCGKAGTGLFVSGDPLGHDHGFAWENGTLVYECSRCGSGRTVYLTVSADAAMTLTAEGSAPAGAAVYAAAYDSSGRMTALELAAEGAVLPFAGAYEVRVFVLDTLFAPIVQPLRPAAATE